MDDIEIDLWKYQIWIFLSNFCSGLLGLEMIYVICNSAQ